MVAPLARVAPLALEAATDRGGERGHAAGQVGQLGGGERLRPVGPGGAGVGVRLHEQPVGAGRDRGQGERRHQGAGAGGVRRVDQHRRARDGPGDGHRGQVERVARHRLEGADAALAQDHARAAGGQQVLGGEQPFLDGGAGGALEQHRPPGAPGGVQEAIVLAVARADLEEVDERGCGGEGGLVEDLDHDRQADLVGRGAQRAERVEAAPLEAVRRRPRLPATAPEQPGAGVARGAGGGEHDFGILDRARPGGEDEIGGSDAGDRTRRVVEPGVWGGGDQHLLDAAQAEQAIARVDREHARRDVRVERGAAGGFDAAARRAQAGELGLDGTDLCGRCAGAKQDDHPPPPQGSAGERPRASRTAQTPNKSETHPFRSKKALFTRLRSRADTIVCS